MREEDIKNMELHEVHWLDNDRNFARYITRVVGGYTLTTKVVNGRSEWNGTVLSANRTETFIPFKN